MDFISTVLVNFLVYRINYASLNALKITIFYLPFPDTRILACYQIPFPLNFTCRKNTTILGFYFICFMSTQWNFWTQFINFGAFHCMLSTIWHSLFYLFSINSMKIVNSLLLSMSSIVPCIPELPTVLLFLLSIFKKFLYWQSLCSKLLYLYVSKSIFICLHYWIIIWLCD